MNRQYGDAPRPFYLIRSAWSSPRSLEGSATSIGTSMAPYQSWFFGDEDKLLERRVLHLLCPHPHVLRDVQPQYPPFSNLVPLRLYPPKLEYFFPAQDGFSIFIIGLAPVRLSESLEHGEADPERGNVRFHIGHRVVPVVQGDRLTLADEVHLVLVLADVVVLQAVSAVPFGSLRTFSWGRVARVGRDVNNDSLVVGRGTHPYCNPRQTRQTPFSSCPSRSSPD